MLRRLLPSFVTLGVLAGAVVATAPASHASGQCTLNVTSRVSIARPYVGVPLSASGACTDGGYGSWDLYHPSRGWQDIAIFDGYRTQVWDVYDWSVAIGRQTWRPGSAWDASYDDMVQNSPVTDVRLGTGAWISTSRSGSVVTLTGTSLLYSVSTQKYFKRSASGVFQYRERGTTTWRNLKSVTTTSAGTATMKYTYSKSRDYRFALYSTPISWDVASAVSTR